MTIGTENMLTNNLNPKSSMIEDPCVDCGNESDYGTHGIKDGEVYDEYYCVKCYGKIDCSERKKDG